MAVAINPFKKALREGRTQIGFWQALANPISVEISAGAGFDWLLLDAEHAPNDVRNILPQLQAAAAYPVHCVVRPPVGDAVLIKQYLDLGVQTLLIPMVQSEEQAADAVKQIGVLNRGRIRAEFDRRFTAHRMAQNYLKLYARLAKAKRESRLPAGTADGNEFLPQSLVTCRNAGTAPQRDSAPVAAIADERLGILQ